MTPYREIAKQALMSWNGLSEEEATRVATTESIESLEGQVWAMSSVKSAVESLANSLGLTEEEKQTFENAVVNGPENNPIFSEISEKTKGMNVEQLDNLTIDSLSFIHDNWVKDNSSEKAFEKKKDREQLRQYAPLEVIGWNEAKNDLLFLSPILNSIGVNLSASGFRMTSLKESYYERVENFFKEKGPFLANLIREGKDFYPALSDDLASKLTPLATTVAHQIQDNWVKNDQRSMQLWGTYADMARDKQMASVAVRDEGPFAAPIGAVQDVDFIDYSNVDYHPASEQMTEPEINEFVEVSTEPKMEQNLNGLSMEELEQYEKTGVIPQKQSQTPEHTNINKM